MRGGGRVREITWVKVEVRRASGGPDSLQARSGLVVEWGREEGQARAPGWMKTYRLGL